MVQCMNDAHSQMPQREQSPQLIVSALGNITHVVQLTLHQALFHLQFLDSSLELCHLNRIPCCVFQQLSFHISHICKTQRVLSWQTRICTLCHYSLSHTLCQVDRLYMHTQNINTSMQAVQDPLDSLMYCMLCRGPAEAGTLEYLPCSCGVVEVG